jgi:N-acetylmuramoyl-L-alanine amidase
MQIQDHWLVAKPDQIEISRTPNVRDGIYPSYLIIHYTAGDTGSEAVDWFMRTAGNPDRIAAHIVIDREGKITQLVPFNRRANHAGSSTWDGVNSLNNHAIGIELVNPGWVERTATGFRRPLGNGKYKNYPQHTASSLMQGKHKNRLCNAVDWFTFPEPQLVALYQLSELLVKHYQLKQVLGHDDISPVRKTDPGPAFPWATFKMKVLGSSDRVGSVYVVNTDDTKFRIAPSRESGVIKSLPKGYELGLIETVGNWSRVYLCHTRADVIKQEVGSDNKVREHCIKTIGYVHNSLITIK